MAHILLIYYQEGPKEKAAFGIDQISTLPLRVARRMLVECKDISIAMFIPLNILVALVKAAVLRTIWDQVSYNMFSCCLYSYHIRVRCELISR